MGDQTCVCGRKIVFFPEHHEKIVWRLAQVSDAYYGCEGCGIRIEAIFGGGCRCPPIGYPGKPLVT